MFLKKDLTNYIKSIQLVIGLLILRIVYYKKIRLTTFKETKMAIIITTNDGESQKQEVFDNRDDLNKKQAVQAEPTNEVDKPEKTTEESATEEQDENRDKSFDYLNSNEEDDESEDHDDDEDDENDEEEQVEKPKKNGFKKRVDKLTKRLSDYEAKIAHLESQVANKGNNQEKANEQVIVEDLKEPDINDFEQYSDYVKALAKYEVNQEKKQLVIKNEEELVKKEAEKITADYRTRVEEAKKRYGEDRWNGLQKIDLPLSIQMRAEIMQSELGPDILFYLYHNLDENKKINSLTPAQQIKELTKLEFKLADKIPKKGEDKKAKDKVSNAPTPARPINSKTDGKSSKDPSKMTYQEHRAWMAERESKRK